MCPGPVQSLTVAVSAYVQITHNAKHSDVQAPSACCMFKIVAEFVFLTLHYVLKQVRMWIVPCAIFPR